MLSKKQYFNPPRSLRDFWARFLGSLLFILIAACNPPSAVKPPPAPNLRSLPTTFFEELIVRRKVSGLTVQIYNTGRMQAKGGAVSSLKSWEAKVRLDIPVFLIHHPKEGLILFDTGLSVETTERLNSGWIPSSYLRFTSEPGQDIVSQMRMNKKNPEEVRWVILSHLHLDHAGMVGSFPQATVVVSKREWEEQKTKQSKRKDLKEFDPVLYENRLKLKLIDFEGAPSFGMFDHASDLFSDGTVYLIDLAGHTEGEVGAWVGLDGGPVMLIGDAAYVVDNYMDLALPTKKTMADVDEYWRKTHMIHAMQEAIPRLVVLPGHDLTPRTLTDRADLQLISFPASGKQQ